MGKYTQTPPAAETPQQPRNEEAVPEPRPVLAEHLQDIREELSALGARITALEPAVAPPNIEGKPTALEQAQERERKRKSGGLA